MAIVTISVKYTVVPFRECVLVIDSCLHEWDMAVPLSLYLFCVKIVMGQPICLVVSFVDGCLRRAGHGVCHHLSMFCLFQ